MAKEKEVKQQDERLKRIRSSLGGYQKEDSGIQVSYDDIQSDLLELDSDLEMEGLVDSITSKEKSLKKG